jgi:glycosyltransferase involved in cell wall biosynthesis
MAHLSAVVPIYREEETLDELCKRLKGALGSITDDFEIVLVEDGGGDRSWEIIRAEFAKDRRVKGIKFSRNFGQHYAISAGLNEADGDWVVVMDGDLQDRPEVIPELYAKAQEGFDVVFVARQQRPEGLGYRILQRCFYAIFQYLAKTEYDPEHGNFSMLCRDVVNRYRDFNENLRFYGGLVKWLGFRHTTIKAQHGTRFAGDTKYSFHSRLVLAFHMILAHSDRPLRIAIGLGLTMSTLSFLYGIWIIWRAIFGDVSVEGWASLIASVYFIGGVILSVLGIMGLYIGKIFDQTKSRPLYIVQERVGFSEKSEKKPTLAPRLTDTASVH